jgi:hypothetical protein
LIKQLFSVREFNLSYYTGSAYGPLNFIVGESNRLKINPNGNILIGTTTDVGFKLDVNGTGRFSGSLTGTSAIFSSSVTAGGTNYLVNTSTGTNAVYQRILNTGGDLILGLNSSAGNSLAAGGLAYATSIYNNTNTAMQFGTNAVFNMTIAAGGNVGIGLNNPSALLNISGPNNDVSGNYYSQLKINGTGTYPDNIAGLSFENSGVQQHIRFVESGVPKLQIRYNAGNTIDNRLKYYSFITNTDFITFDGNNGNVLIGTTTDNGDKLRVSGNMTLNGKLGVNSGSISGISLVVLGENNGSADYFKYINYIYIYLLLLFFYRY